MTRDYSPDEILFLDRLNVGLLAIALIGLVFGLGLSLAGLPEPAAFVWSAGVVPVLAALLVEIVRSLWKGEVGLDIVAALSMSAALFFGETLAAAVVALMYSGGTFLESFAEGRARREMSDLLSRVPRTATRHRNGALDEVPLDDIAPRRPAADPAGRRGARGWHPGKRPRDARPVGADGRVHARTAGPRAGRDERLDERGRSLRSARHAPRGGQHLCRDRQAGRSGAEVQGADGSAGRPLFATVPRRHGRSGRPPGGSPAIRSAQSPFWSSRRRVR